MCVFPINSSACQGLRGAHGETIESFCRVYSIRRQILENVYRSGYDSRAGEVLQLRELTVELPTAAGSVKPVNGVSLGIPPGESLGLIGESGSGKTMLSLALMGLLPPGARVSGEARLASRHERKAADGADRSRNGAPFVAVMRGGQFVELRPAERILREPRSPYTRELLAAVPEIPRPAKV